ncbi:transcriptional regulator [Tersicoccus solisilvae]|uniref:Transcriptional regulator n=1 Tax=Tersicoccus solisilvae TaxID=1882339 RepID=A0ABQ1P441_9MICC|nr:LCP family protein [Tersicoccus solisilvae]GGC90016.1 transcriptional regulator [Tersicoccus solisilvae]
MGLDDDLLGHESGETKPDDGDAATPRSSRRKLAKRIGLALVALVLVVALVVGIYLVNLGRSFDTKTQKIEQAFPAESSRPSAAAEAAGATNILLLGSDSRGATASEASSGTASDQRSDTMIWVHIPADRKHVYLMSVMRDLWVDIPGHGTAKINAAMAEGGIPLAAETLEQLFGTRLDHIALIDFEGFKAATDALGGVTVNVPIAFSTKTHTFAQGKQTLDGDAALAFVRERKAFTDGDFQRVKDQQIFVKAVLSQVLSAGTLTNPVKVSDLVDKVSPYVSVDTTLDSGTMASLALSLNGVRASDVQSFTLPTKGTGTSADGQSIVLADTAAIKAVGTALKNDTVADWLSSRGSGE